MSTDLIRIQKKVKKYKQILKNTKQYRKAWNESMKPLIVETLERISEETKLNAEIQVQDNLENLELIIFSLGRTTSGISEKVDDDVLKPMIKFNGALIYQQLFNGKVLIMISLPFIEGNGEPRPPSTVEILRPHELNEEFIYRHVEKFFNDVTAWEDYDDDAPLQKPTFNPIGFNKLSMEDQDGITDEA
jgi:hypothetical protein